MNQADVLREVRLTFPADKCYAPVASLALSGLGMVIGLDVDLLGDLRMVTTECVDCLIHQAGKPQDIEMTAFVKEGRLHVQFESLKRESMQAADDLALEIARGVLETLMPQVELHADEEGVHGITCSMPV